MFSVDLAQLDLSSSLVLRRSHLARAPIHAEGVVEIPQRQFGVCRSHDVVVDPLKGLVGFCVGDGADHVRFGDHEVGGGAAENAVLFAEPVPDPGIRGDEAFGVFLVRFQVHATADKIPPAARVVIVPINDVQEKNGLGGRSEDRGGTEDVVSSRKKIDRSSCVRIDTYTTLVQCCTMSRVHPEANS